MRTHIKLKLFMALDLISQPQQLFWKSILAGQTVAQDDFIAMSQRQPKLLAQTVTLNTLAPLTPQCGLPQMFLSHLLTRARQNSDAKLCSAAIRLCPPVTELLTNFCETLSASPKLIKPCAPDLKHHFETVQNNKPPFIIHTVLIDATLNTQKGWPFWALKENLITIEEDAPFVFEHIQQMNNRNFEKSTNYKLNSAHQKFKLTKHMTSKSSEDFLKSDFFKEINTLI